MAETGDRARRRAADMVAALAVDHGAVAAAAVASWPLQRFAMGPGLTIPLPDTLEDIAETIGRRDAVKLSDAVHCRGRVLPRIIDQDPADTSRPWRRSVYIPERVAADHWLAQALGLEVARNLAWTHGNLIIEIPGLQIMRRRRQHWLARRLAADGVPLAEIAAALECTVKTVRAAVAENAPEASARGDG